MIPNRQFKTYIDKFKELQSSPNYELMFSKKWKNFPKISELLQEENIETLTNKDLEEIYSTLPIGQKNKSKFLSNSVTDIQECLWFLLWEELSYEMRVWEFLDDMGGYKLLGTDINFTSGLLSAQNPDLYGIINTNTTKGFKILELELDFYKNESKAGIFQKNQEALWELSYISEFNNLFLTHDFLECLAKKLIT